MLSPFILTAALAIGQADLDRGDELNRAHVECMFATSRSAHQRHLSNEEFSRLLASACKAERENLHAFIVDILQRRGKSAAEAKAEWVRLEAAGRASVERAYAVGSGAAAGKE